MWHPSSYIIWNIHVALKAGNMEVGRGVTCCHVLKSPVGEDQTGQIQSTPLTSSKQIPTGRFRVIIISKCKNEIKEKRQSILPTHGPRSLVKFMGLTPSNIQTKLKRHVVHLPLSRTRNIWSVVWSFWRCNSLACGFKRLFGQTCPRNGDVFFQYSQTLSVWSIFKNPTPTRISNHHVQRYAHLVREFK